MRDALQYYSPLEIFETIITPEIYDHIIKESVRYSATSKNTIDILSVDELKTFIGILMLSSYHKLLSTRNYWSNEEDLGVPIIKKAMTRNNFQHLKSIINFCNNERWEENKSDRGFKVRSLIEMIQKSFKKYEVFEKNLSVDEMIIKYYGHNSLKQLLEVSPLDLATNFGPCVACLDIVLTLNYIAVKMKKKLNTMISHWEVEPFFKCLKW